MRDQKKRPRTLIKVTLNTEKLLWGNILLNPFRKKNVLNGLMLLGLSQCMLSEYIAGYGFLFFYT